MDWNLLLVPSVVKRVVFASSDMLEADANDRACSTAVVPTYRVLDLLWARPIYKFNKSITLWLVIVGITICTGLEVKRTLTQLK